jgi:hypothetical protein
MGRAYAGPVNPPACLSDTRLPGFRGAQSGLLADATNGKSVGAMRLSDARKHCGADMIANNADSTKTGKRKREQSNPA